MTITRRFAVAALALAALAGCATVPTAPAAPVEQVVSITTPDGAEQAVWLHPAGRGPWPAVVVLPDIMALRPAFVDLGRKLAGQGYAVLVPNNFYRSAPLDGSTSPGTLSAAQSTDRLNTWRAAASDDGVARDAVATLAWLDARPEVDRRRKAGVIGYNVGGAHAFRYAAAVPGRVGAVAVLHPLGVATARPNSPHLLVPQAKAAWFVALAKPDDDREPGDKDDLRKAFADAGQAGTVTVYPAGHGFAVADNAAFDAAQESAAWAQVLALLGRALR